MDTIHHVEIIINIFLQSLGGWLNLLSQFFSFLGQEEFYILVLPALYWCVNASWGIRIGVMLVLTVNLNSWLKLAFASPRPFWIDARVKELAVETSFGLPSGHAMNSTSIWGLLATLFKKKWLTYTITAVVFLIGFSRIVLGVHFASDVLAGWLAGGLLLAAFVKWEKPISDRITRTSFEMQLVLGLISSLAILAISFLFLRLRSGWTLPVEWLVNAPDLNPLDPSGMVTLAGVWLGFSLSLVWWNHRHGMLQPMKTWKVNVVRYVIGVVGLFIIWYVLGLVFPHTVDAGALALRYLRYAIVGAWVGGLAPTLFLKLKV